MIETPLHLLLVEDSEDDALLLLRALQKGGFKPECRRVDTCDDLREALALGGWDLVVSDYMMPGFGGMEALDVVRQHGLDVPFIMISGRVGEEVAVEAMRRGASDYITKNNLARLIPAIQRELKEAHVRAERRVAEEALADSRQRYEQLVNSVQGIVWEADASTFQFTFVSRHAENLLGYSVEEWRRPGFWVEHVHPEDSWAVGFCTKATEEMRAHDFEYRFVAKDGHVVWLHDLVKVVARDGRPALLRGLMVDITQIREAEARVRQSEVRFRALFETSPVAMTLSEQDGRMLLLNRKFVETFGYTLDEVPVMQAWWSHAFPDAEYRERVQALWDMGLSEAQRNNTHAGPYEVIVACRNGTAKHVLVSGIFVEGSLLLIYQDITEHKLFTRSLKQLNETLEQRVAEEAARNREKDHLLIQQSRLAAMGDMIGNIAHQWRQPLNALNILISNIKDIYELNEMTPQDMNQMASTGHRLIQKMSTTIDDFRNFFKPNKTRMHFSLAQVVDETLALLSGMLKNHNIEVIFDKGEDAQVFGFPNELSQVLLNLLTNAREAITAHKKPGRVEISIVADATRPGLVVRDNGGGIPEDALPHVFDPYFTTKPMGTGVGLYMSKMIMGHMDGDIVARNWSEGAEMELRIPSGEGVTVAATRSLMEWQDSFEVGHPLVDAQHREMVELVNRVHESLVHPHTPEALQSVVDNLISFTLFHFETEEYVMKQLGYPDAEQHRAGHDRLISMLRNYQRPTGRDGGTILSPDASEFLSNWLLDHITRDDRKLGEYFRAHPPRPGG